MRTLIETPTFDADIVVPQADDDRHDAAEVVAAIAQKTANRTLYLKQVVEAFVIPDPPNLAPYARKDTANTFTAKQTLGAEADVVGTLHASVDVTAQRDLNAVRNVNAGNGNVSAKLVHSDTDVTSDRDVLAARAVVAGDGLSVSAGDAEIINGDLILHEGHRVRHVGDDASRERWLPVPLALAQASLVLAAPSYDDVGDVLGKAGSTGSTDFVLPLLLPVYAKLRTVLVGQYQFGGGDPADATMIRVCKRRAIDWDLTGGDPSAPPVRAPDALETLRDNATSERFDRVIVTSLAVSGDEYIVDDSTFLYLLLRVTGENMVYGVRVAYVDP